MPALEPDLVFRIASSLAGLGWLMLAVGVWRHSALLRDRVAGLAVPVVLSLGYTVLVMVHFADAQGSFATLQGVAALSRSPWVLLAGWVHYLAFDLLVGAWVARDAAKRGVARWPLLLVLPLVFLFGPAGYVAWLVARTVWPTPSLTKAATEGLS